MKNPEPVAKVPKERSRRSVTLQISVHRGGRRDALCRVRTSSSPVKRMVFIAGLTILGLAGCVGYRLGSTLPPDIKTVYVPLFANKSREPLIENNATVAAIAELQKDGTLKVVNVENADVILECTLTGVSLNPLKYDRSDVTRPNEYRLTLSASFTLKRVRDQEILCEASVIGEATFLFVGNLVSAKQSAIPRASEDLAKRIVEKAVEAW